MCPHMRFPEHACAVFEPFDSFRNMSICYLSNGGVDNDHLQSEEGRRDGRQAKIGDKLRGRLPTKGRDDCGRDRRKSLGGTE